MLLNFFKVVVQAVLLFVLETCVVIPRIGRMLGVFRHSVDHRMKVNQPWIQPDGVWEYPHWGEGDEVVRVVGGEGVYSLDTEHSHTIHLDVDDYRSL